MLNDLTGNIDEVVDRDAFLDSALFAEKSALGCAGQMQNGLTQGLGRDRPGIDCGAAQDRVLFNDTDTFPKFGRLNGGLLARRTGPDHNTIKMSHRNSPGTAALAVTRKSELKFMSPSTNC